MLILNSLGVALTLLLMFAVFSTLNARTSMRSQSDGMLELSRVIAANAAPLLQRNDRLAATGLLSSLSASPDITQAVIFDPRGTTFASWSANKAAVNEHVTPPNFQASQPTVHTGQSRLEIDFPILVSGHQAGALRLRGQQPTIKAASYEFELIGIAFTAGAIVLLVLILHRGHLRLLASALEVSEVASRIVQSHEHQLRTRLEGSDELGHLTQRFGQLLKQLESQNGIPANMHNSRAADATVFDRLINYDRVTRLPGRHFFRNALNSAVQSAAERRELAALMLIGLDEPSASCPFTTAKLGNDAIRRTAKRMELMLRSSDLLCHLDDGQFAVILPTVNRLPQVQLLAERLIDAATADEDGAQLRVSVGIACCPTDAEDSFSLLRQADMAMYAARYSGTSTYRFFDKVIAHATQTTQPPRERTTDQVAAQLT
jgi:diguanylate cyclase (GGDEF)-like protein